MNQSSQANSLSRGIILGAAGVALLCVAAATTQIAPTSDGPRVFGLWELTGFAITLFVAGTLMGLVLIKLAAPQHRRRRVFGMLATAFSLGSLYLTLELATALHLVDYRNVLATEFIKPWENPRNILDPELLYTHPPHEHYVGAVHGDLVGWYGIPTTRLYPVDFRYDHRGFRNNEDREHADVVVVGDSKVEGSLVPFEEITTSRLESMLGVPVLNLGQIGYSPQQSAVVLRRFGLPATPKVIVWMLFEGNDLTLDYERYRRTTADFDGFVRQNHGFLARSFTRNLFLSVSRWTSPTSDENYQRGLNRSCLLTEGTHSGERLYFAYKPIDLSAVGEEQLRAPLEFVREGQSACAGAGVHFLFVFVPIKYRVYHGLCDIDPSAEAASWELHDIPGFVQQWAAQHDIQFVDLTSALRDRAAAGDLVYYLDDGHWTAVGHGVAATRIVEVFESKGWLSRSNHQETDRKIPAE